MLWNRYFTGIRNGKWDNPYSTPRMCTAKLTKITVRWRFDDFFVCTNGYIFQFLQLLLCRAEILLEKYPVWQLAVPYSSVVKQNCLNTNVIANCHILIIRIWSGYGNINFHSNWQIFTRCLACNMKWTAIHNTSFEKSMHIPVIFW